MDEETRKKFKQLFNKFIDLNDKLTTQLSKNNPCNLNTLRELRENIVTLNDIARGR